MIEDIENIEGYEEFNLIEEKDDVKYLGYSHIFIMAYSEIQKLKKEIDSLKEHLTDLKKKN